MDEAKQPDIIPELRSEAVNWSASCGDLFDRAANEIFRLRNIIRSCVHGAEMVDIGNGELIGLHLPNKSLASQPSPAATVETERRCQECGETTKGEEALVDGQIWCHPCADAHSGSPAANDIAALELAAWIEANGLSHFNLQFGIGTEKRAAQVAMIVTALRHMAAEPQAAPVCAEPVTISIKRMALSDGSTDYYVALIIGKREITPYKFKEEWQAQYEADSFRWLFLGAPKPDLLAYGPTDTLAVTRPERK